MQGNIWVPTLVRIVERRGGVKSVTLLPTHIATAPRYVLLEQYTGLEPVPSAWKAEMLTVEHQYCMYIRWGAGNGTRICT